MAQRSLTRALVLGGAGFLGSWVTQTLTDLKVETSALGYGARRPQDAPLAITRATVGEMLDRHSYDAVFFLAGSPSVPLSVRDPWQDLHDNTVLVVDVLEVLRHLASPPVFVFTSSAAVYGDSQREPMDEDHPLLPRSPYGISKLAAEHYVRLYTETYQIPSITVRPFSVYGPGQRKLVIYDLLTRLLAGEDPLVVNSPGEIARDFVFVRDLARGIVALSARAPGTGEAYNLASGIATTLSELVEQLVEVSGARASIRFTGTLRVGDPVRWRGDTTKARELGISCQTSLTTGLDDTVKWVRTELAES